MGRRAAVGDVGWAEGGVGVIFFYSFATLLRKEKKKSTLPDPALQASIFSAGLGGEQ